MLTNGQRTALSGVLKQYLITGDLRQILEDIETIMAGDKE
jgi:hypothetical protein